MGEPAGGGAGRGAGAGPVVPGTTLTNSADGGRIGLQGRNYKWVALSNTTLGMLSATVNSSIVIISLPAIFRGIKLNPLTPGNVSYLLWMLMGYMVVSAVLVVTLGRLGDIYGRVRMYNFGFAIFGLGALALPFDPLTGPKGALWLIGFRVIQAVGGAMIMGNSPAILTDAFPADQRGMAMGINQVAGISGQFIGLILGGVLAAVDWRLVFLVSVPIGIGGTIWSYLSLREIGARTPARIDWLGNLAFGLGLVGLLVGITYGLIPYGGHPMGWTNPLVLAGLIGGVALLVTFCVIELRVTAPMFDLRLMRIRAFAAGNVATLMAAIARGGLQFMLILWLQGIWLVLHGYDFKDTPLWSGIYLLPLTCGFVLFGPLSGKLSDKHGARAFASGGLLVSAAGFGGLLLLPTDFRYVWFAVLIFVAGAGMGLFSAPNAAAIMNSVPARQRGAASGMLATFQNSGMVLSIGIFFSLMITGLAGTLPKTLTNGLASHGVPLPVAHAVGAEPPVASLFAAFLGYNPVQQLLAPTGVLTHLPTAQVTVLTGRQFFPGLISGPFHHGLVIVFGMAMAVLVLASGISLLRGGRFVHEEAAAAAPGAQSAVDARPTAGARPATGGQNATRGQTAAGGQNADNGQNATGGRPAGKGQTAASGQTVAGGQPAGNGQTAASMQPAPADPAPANGARLATNGQAEPTARPTATDEMAANGGQNPGNGGPAHDADATQQLSAVRRGFWRSHN